MRTTRIQAKHIIYFVLFVLFFALNFLSPPQNDDLIAPIIHEYRQGIFNPQVKLFSLDSAIESYQRWNARFGELLFLAFICKLPAHVFDFINAFMGVFSIVLFFALIFSRFPRDKYDFAIVVFLAWQSMLLMPFEEMFLWCDGSLNYLWAWVLVMLSCIPYRIFYQNLYCQSKSHEILRIKLDSPLSIFVFCVLNFCAGMSNEIFAVIVICVHVVLICFAMYKKISLPLWYKCGILAFMLGFVALYFSPGQNRRGAVDDAYGEFFALSQLLSMSLVDKLHRIYDTINLGAQKIPIFFFVFYFCILSFAKKYSVNRIIFACIFAVAFLVFLIICINKPFIALLLLLCGFVYAGYKQKSFVFFAAGAMLCLVILCILSTIQLEKPSPRVRISMFLLLCALSAMLVSAKLRFRAAGIIIVVLSCLYFMYVAGNYVDFYIKHYTLEQYIAEQKRDFKGEKEICTTIIHRLSSKYYCVPIDIVYPKEKWSFHYPYFSPWWALRENTDSDLNGSWAFHYKIKSIRLAGESTQESR